MWRFPRVRGDRGNRENSGIAEVRCQVFRDFHDLHELAETSAARRQGFYDIRDSRELADIAKIEEASCRGAQTSIKDRGAAKTINTPNTNDIRGSTILTNI